MEIKTITKNGLRFYEVPNKGYYKSTTSVVGLLDKPVVHDWAIKETVKWLSKQKKIDEATIAKAIRYSKFKLNQLADIGTAKHKAAETYLLTKKYDDKDKWILKFIKWTKEVDFKTNKNLLERVLISDKYKVAGRADMIGRVFGEPTLIDIKTSSGVYLSHKIQVCGYKLMTGKKDLKVAILQISRDGYRKKFYILDEKEEKTCTKIFIALNTIFGCMLDLNELRVDKAIRSMV